MVLLPRRARSVGREGERRAPYRWAIAAQANSQAMECSSCTALPIKPTSPQRTATRAKHSSGLRYANRSAGATRSMTSMARPVKRRARRSKCVVDMLSMVW